MLLQPNLQQQEVIVLRKLKKNPKKSKPHFQFSEKSGDVSLSSRPSRRVSIQDTSRVTGRSKQRRSKQRSIILVETPKAIKKDVSQLHAEDFTPIRPSTRKKNSIEKAPNSNREEIEQNVGKDRRKKIPSFQLIDTPPKVATRRSTRLSSVQDRNIPRPKAQGRRLGSEITGRPSQGFHQSGGNFQNPLKRTFAKSRRSMSESDVVPDVVRNKPFLEPSKLATHSKSAKVCPPVSKTTVQDKTSKRRSTRISRSTASDRANENTNSQSPSMKKPRLSKQPTQPKQPTKSRSKNASNIDLFMPDCFSPVLSKKTEKKIDTNRKVSPKSVLSRLNIDDDDQSQSVSQSTLQPILQSTLQPASKPPPKAGSSLLSKPLLLRSKPSTEGFKMPKRN